MPSLDDTKTEAKEPEEIDDWDVLTGGGDEEKESKVEPPGVEPPGAEQPVAKTGKPEPDPEAEPDPPTKTAEPEKPKPAANKKTETAGYYDAIRGQSSPKKISVMEPAPSKSLAINPDRLARGASMLQDLGEVLIFLGGIVKQDCEKRAGKSAPSCMGQDQPAAEGVDIIPSRILVLIEPADAMDGFDKGDMFDVEEIEPDGTVFVTVENGNYTGFHPGEFEVIAWHGASLTEDEIGDDDEETEIGWRAITLADAGAPMSECLSRSNINTLGNLVDYYDSEKPLEKLSGVGKLKAEKINNWASLYFAEHDDYRDA